MQIGLDSMDVCKDEKRVNFTTLFETHCHFSCTPPSALATGYSAEIRMSVEDTVLIALIDNLMSVAYGFRSDIGLHDLHFHFSYVSTPFQI